jgi:hypothetical protein
MSRGLCSDSSVPAVFQCAGATTVVPSSTASLSTPCAVLIRRLPLPPTCLQGWSPERAKRFGAALLPAVYEVVPTLRTQ